MKAIVLDMYGVIVKQTGDDFVPYVQQTFPDLSPEEIYTPWFKADIGELTSLEVWEAIGFQGDLEKIEKEYLDTIELMDGFIDFIEKVKGKYKTTNSDFFFMAMTGNAMIRLGEFTDGDSETTFDESWLPNDGLVNVTSALYPEGNPHKWYEGEKAEKGIWNVMPVQKGDHGTAIGLFADKKQTREFYDNLIKTLSSLE
jgi:hypothetical protein